MSDQVDEKLMQQSERSWTEVDAPKCPLFFNFYHSTSTNSSANVKKRLQELQPRYRHTWINYDFSSLNWKRNRQCRRFWIYSFFFHIFSWKWNQNPFSYLQSHEIGDCAKSKEAFEKVLVISNIIQKAAKFKSPLSIRHFGWWHTLWYSAHPSTWCVHSKSNKAVIIRHFIIYSMK